RPGSTPPARRPAPGRCAERRAGTPAGPSRHCRRAPPRPAPRDGLPASDGTGHNGPMDTLTLDGRRYTVGRATAADLPELVALLADDVLGRERESTELAPYEQAFARIDRDSNQLLVAVRDASGGLVATTQLTLLPSLSRGGATRLQIEAVRGAAARRGRGPGCALRAWAHRSGAAPCAP